MLLLKTTEKILSHQKRLEKQELHAKSTDTETFGAGKESNRLTQCNIAKACSCLENSLHKHLKINQTIDLAFIIVHICYLVTRCRCIL